MTIRDLGIEFENWIRHTLPWQLNLSPSKEVAVNIKFGGFADYVRQLADKDPKSFELFYDELRKKFTEIATWRAPKGTRTAPLLTKEGFDDFPNGKHRHTLWRTDEPEQVNKPDE